MQYPQWVLYYYCFKDGFSRSNDTNKDENGVIIWKDHVKNTEDTVCVELLITILFAVYIKKKGK